VLHLLKHVIDLFGHYFYVTDLGSVQGDRCNTAQGEEIAPHSFPDRALLTGSPPRAGRSRVRLWRTVRAAAPSDSDPTRLGSARPDCIALQDGFEKAGVVDRLVMEALLQLPNLVLVGVAAQH